MPHLAHVQVRHLPCPQCFKDLADQNLVGFQWGYCCGVFAAPDYQVGDPIKWRVGKDRIAYKWSYFRRGGGNIGDPNYFNVLVRAAEYYGLRQCRSCDYQFAGIGIRIEDGIIQDVRVYEDGLPDSEISIINDDDTLTPMPDWDDHSMPIVDAGWRTQLVPQTVLAHSTKET